MNSVDLRQSDFSSIARLPKLTALYLRGSQVSDAMVISLKSSKSLENIDLSNNAPSLMLLFLRWLFCLISRPFALLALQSMCRA
jgi:Leucine-rich repeat (LRR) protein